MNNLAGDVLGLAQLGAQHFLVPNMPDLGRTPEAIALGPLAQTQLELLSLGFNGGLGTAMNQLESLFGLDVHVFDTFAFMNYILDDPVAAGFTDTTTPCVLTPAVLTGCAGFVFFDNVHPTTEAHALLGAGFPSAVPLRLRSPWCSAGWCSWSSRRPGASAERQEAVRGTLTMPGAVASVSGTVRGRTLQGSIEGRGTAGRG